MLKAKFHKNLEFVKENFLVTFQKKDLMIKISNVFSVPVQVLIFRLFASQNLNGSKPQCCPPRYLSSKYLNFGFLVSSVFTHKIPFHPPRCRLAETRENAEAENEEHACLQKIGHDGYAGLQQAGLAALPHTFIFCPRSLQFQTLWSSPG